MRIPALVATAVLVTVTSSCCSIVSLDAFVLPMLPGGHININSSSSNTSNNNKNAGLLGLSMIRRKSSSPSVTKSIFDIEDGSNQTDDDEEKEESASLLGKSSLFFESLFQSSSKKNDDDDDGIVVSATRPVPMGPTSTTSSDNSSRRNRRRNNQLQKEEQEEESAAPAATKFDMEQRVESFKSIVLGALAGGIAVSPIAFFHYVGNLPQ
eukprot:CAMPEP_0113479340 /NCGR_PEP_ID=MMETSP0014_2-20120614/21254_1 /TAXON_ID=2857 /ORGANISM="Nitzschia sp." /LENGTH=209 /DNA_ID=CAMNT_0000372625 /DNA_START=1 /DNA_END=627 /DNA_ORIENTATION=+ /assembly_acc=CAM_ASM_000159